MPRRIEYQVEVENNTKRGLNSVNRDVSRAFERVTSNTSSRFNAMGKSISSAATKAGASLATIGTAATGAAAGVGVLTAGLGAFIKSQQQAASTIAIQSKEMSISTQRYQQLSHVAKVAGTDVDAFKDAMENLNGKLYDASTGSEDTMEAFNSLGISIYNTDGSLKTSAQTLDEVIPRLAEVEDKGRRAALADELLSGAAAKLTGVFGMQGEELAELYEEGLKYAVVSDRMIKLSEENRKAQVLLGASFKGLMTTLAEPMMPIFTKSIEVATSTIQKIIPIVQSVISKTMNEVGKLADVYSDFLDDLGELGVIDFATWALEKFGDMAVWIATNALPFAIRGVTVFLKSIQLLVLSLKGSFLELELAVVELDNKIAKNKALSFFAGKPVVSDEYVAKSEENLLRLRESFHINFAKIEEYRNDLLDSFTEPLGGDEAGKFKMPEAPKAPKAPKAPDKPTRKLTEAIDDLSDSIKRTSTQFIDLFAITRDWPSSYVNEMDKANKSLDKHIEILHNFNSANKDFNVSMKQRSDAFVSASTGLTDLESIINTVKASLNSFSVDSARDMSGLVWNLRVSRDRVDSITEALSENRNEYNALIDVLTKYDNLSKDQAKFLLEQYEETKTIISDTFDLLTNVPVAKLNEMVEAFRPEVPETFKDKIKEVNDEFFNILDTIKVVRDAGYGNEQEYTDRVIELNQIKADKIAEIEQEITDKHNEEIRKRVNAANASVAESMSILNSTMSDTVGVIKDSLSNLSPDVEQALGVYKAISALSTLNEFLGSNVEAMGENILTLKEQFPNGAFENVLFGGEGSEAFGELIAATSELTNSVFNTMADIAATSSERSMEKLKEREEALDEWFDTEKNKLKGSRRNRRFYERDLAKLEEEKAKRQEQILKEQEKAQAEAARKQLGIQLVQAVASTALGVANALTMSPPPLAIAMAAIIGAMGAVQVGLIASQMSKFAEGGIVEGPSVGDQNMIRANGGEMVLTKQQQATLFNMANGGRGSGGGSIINGIDMSVNIQGDADRETVAAISENQNEKLELLRSQLEELSYRGDLTPIVQGI